MDKDTQTGIIEAVLERFETQRLPRTLDIKANVDAGERLTDTDIAFLNEVMRDAESVKRIVDQRPDLQPLYTRVVDLYQGILRQALANEQGGPPAAA